MTYYPLYIFSPIADIRKYPTAAEAIATSVPVIGYIITASVTDNDAAISGLRQGLNPIAFFMGVSNAIAITDIIITVK